MKEITIKKITINRNNLIFLLLLSFIVLISVWSRLGTLKSKTILDYDPWWHYRYTKMILENGLIPPKWDLLSFFPPGRPVDPFLGWEYTMILFYKILSIFTRLSLIEVAKLAPVIMVGLTSIVAYFFGSHLSNKWGGLATSLFSTLTPTFIGVSMAGYSDTDAVVVFYSFLSVYSILLAMNKRKITYTIFAIISNLLFIWAWGAAWYIPFFFILLIPALFVFRIFEDTIHERKLSIDINKIIKEIKPTLMPLLVILVVLNIIGVLFHLSDAFHFLVGGLGFLGAKVAIVNVSVAELQPINIFTKGGFLAVAGRVGLGPMLLAIIGLPIIAIYKVLKSVRIGFSEIFLFMWMAVTFYLILHGVRFSLLFSVAVAASAGYVIGNVVNYVKKDIFGVTVFGVITLLLLTFVSDAILYANQASGMEVGQNWIDMFDWLKENADPKAIIATWWDPGHIIAGYTGLRVHADGAHCTPDRCIPYPHNTRIQNMGRIMSTSGEGEAVELLKKYMVLTEEQCSKANEVFNNIVPKEGCEPASEMYFIASSDLIGKYTWMNYFGGFRAPIASNQDFLRNPGVCCASTPKTESGQMSCGQFANKGKGVWVWCPWVFTLSDVKKDQEGNPVYVYDYSGLKMSIIQKGNQIIPVYNNQFLINHLIFFNQGQAQVLDLSSLNTTLQKIDGLVWADPSFRNLIYLSPSVRNSMFVRLFFFNGEGLEHFELVYSNPEIKLFRVNFE